MNSLYDVDLFCYVGCIPRTPSMVKTKQVQNALTALKERLVHWDSAGELFTPTLSLGNCFKLTVDR